jgi:hypothetical protein
MATRAVAKKATCSDGSAQPPQLDWMTTPNGRGRRAIAPTTLAANKTTTFAKMSKTIRWRKRLSASSANTSPANSTLRTNQELRAARACLTAPAPAPGAPPAT